ncbi:thiol:disulfide interchange protein DsbA/DsbL [Pseudoduganella sp. RAF53_2]|uniref:thiol:disulfide interchange protein DsbA/DsbL n=1 Tax=unclassified Pseudoduganella TaxID=2637179 RepID=UPI003F9C6BC6
MQILKKFLVLTTLSFAALGALASPADPKPGAEYTVLKAPQSTDTGKKVEVIEFFAYYCPHCYALEPKLAEWVKKQGDTIVFKRVHVSRGQEVLPQQKLFFTLEALGLVEQYHNKVFNAMHVEHNRLNRDEQVFEWIEKNGIDKNKFIDTYRGFGIAARVRHTDPMMEAYEVDSWPMIAIDGKYLTSPYIANHTATAPMSEAQQQQNALQVMDFLVAKAKAEKK